MGMDTIAMALQTMALRMSRVIVISFGPLTRVTRYRSNSAL